MLAAVASIATDRAPVTTERVSELAGFEALRQEWDELLQRSNSACVFLTWEWLFTWWKHLSEDRHLSILAIRRGRELIAIAPLCLRPRSLSRARPLPVIEFLGSGFVGSDYLDVIVRKGDEAEAREALTAHLGSHDLSLKLTNVKHGESVAASVFTGLSQEGWTVTETQTNSCPFIPLAGVTWDSYLASLSAEHRYTFHRKSRRLHKDYVVRFEAVRTKELCSEAIDLLIAQHNLRWETRGGSDAFHTAGLIAFHREWIQVALNRGWLRFYVLRLNEKPAACLYGLLYRGTFYFYQSSFDAAYQQHSVGFIAMGLAIQKAIEEGAEEYDLLHGNETYKSHWSSDTRDLARLEAFPPSGLGQFYRRSMQFGRTSREFGRASRAMVHRMTSRGPAA